MTRRAWGAAAGGLALLAGAIGAYWAVRVLGTPAAVVADAALPPAGGLRVQETVAQILLREGGFSRRRDPLAVTAAELNAFLGRHVEIRRGGVSRVVVGLEPDRVTVHGRTTLGRVLAETGPPWLGRLAPRRLLDLPVWVVVRGRLEVAGGRARFAVDAASVGRQPISPALVPRLIPPELVAPWPLPRVVERVEIQPGRLVVHTR